jgi:hypothetical protein
LALCRPFLWNESPEQAATQSVLQESLLRSHLLLRLK